MFTCQRCPSIARVVEHSIGTARIANHGFVLKPAPVKILSHIASFHTRHTTCTSLFTTRKASVFKNKWHASCRASSVAGHTGHAGHLGAGPGPKAGSEPGIDISDEELIWPQSRHHKIQVSQHVPSQTRYTGCFFRG